MPKSKITLRELNGRPIFLELDDEITVAKLREEVCSHLGITDPTVRFVFRARLLEDGEVLASLKVQPDEFIVVNRVMHPPPVVPMPFIPQQSPTQVKELVPQVATPPKGASLPGRTKSGRIRPTDFWDRVERLHSIFYRIAREEIAQYLDGSNFDEDAVKNQLYTGRKSPVELPPAPAPAPAPAPKPAPAPAPAPAPKPKPQVDVSALARYNFGQLQRVVNEYNNEQKAGLLRVLQTFPDHDAEMLLQMFAACDCDPLVTEHCLRH